MITLKKILLEVEEVENEKVGIIQSPIGKIFYEKLGSPVPKQPNKRQYLATFQFSYSAPSITRRFYSKEEMMKWIEEIQKSTPETIHKVLGTI